MSKRVFLIDGFDDDIAFVPEISSDDELILLTRKENAVSKTSYHELNPFIVISDTRIDAFYQAKVRIDSKMSVDIVFICSKNDGNFWFTVFTELMTSAYNWKLEIPDNYQAKYDEKSLHEITNFLSSYVPKDELVILKSNIIDESLFNHGFSTRKGGLSTARGVASLNITPANIKRDSALIGIENVRRLGLKAGFNYKNFVKAQAVHGNTVYVFGKDVPKDGYDCIVSNNRNVTIAAPGADCVMMVFADAVTQSFGTCHSGWKGTLAKACLETIEKMRNEYGAKYENIKIALGPCIGPCCLEFDKKDADLFKSINEKSVIWKEGKEKPFIDLRLVNRTLLESVGVLPSNIDDSTVTLCTSCHPELFFSYRRDKIPFGNQVGFIGLR